MSVVPLRWVGPRPPAVGRGAGARKGSRGDLVQLLERGKGALHQFRLLAVPPESDEQLAAPTQGVTQGRFQCRSLLDQDVAAHAIAGLAVTVGSRVRAGGFRCTVANSLRRTHDGLSPFCLGF